MKKFIIIPNNKLYLIASVKNIIAGTSEITEALGSLVNATEAVKESGKEIARFKTK